MYKKAPSGAFFVSKDKYSKLKFIAMVNFKSRVLPKQWPVEPMLWLRDVFDTDTLEQLKKFDIDSHSVIPFKGRKQYEFIKDRVDEVPKEFGELMTKLQAELNSVDLLERLITEAVKKSSVKPENAWIGGMDTIRSLYKTCNLSLWEDSEQFDLGVHEDHRNILAVMMVYLSPAAGSSGTRFHSSGNFADFRQLPFIQNTGFFLFNTQYSFHSAVNTEANKLRRSFCCVWTM
jgi:hypothetical protein